LAARGSSPKPGALDRGDQPWLDALVDAALILSPVMGKRGEIVDFRVDYANVAATELDGELCNQGLRSDFLVDRDLQDPKCQGATKLVSVFRTVLKTGVPQALDGLVYESMVAGDTRRQVRDVRVSRSGTHLLVTLRDVTKRKRAEELVTQNGEDLQGLVDGVLDEALVTVAPDGRVVSWNVGARRIYGYFAAEIIGRHHSVLYPHVWPDGTNQDLVGLTVREGDSQYETWQVRKNGKRFRAGVSITATHGPDGELRGFSTVTRDLTEEVEHRRQELYLEVVRALDQASETDAAADAVLELTTIRLRASFGEMFILRAQDGRAESTSRHAFPHSSLDALEAAGDPQGISRWDGLVQIFRTTVAGTPVTVPDICELGKPGQAAAAALGLRSAIACPIVAASGTVGVLVYFFESLPGVDDEVPGRVQEIADEMSRFLTRAGAQAALKDEVLKLAELASTDRLTGLKNRREFDRMMGTIPRKPYAILAIDVDHLKRVNDQYGHEAGDLVLRTVGTTLGLMLRGWDVVARVGGDEFAAILLDVDAAQAEMAAERLHASMHLVPAPDERANISVGWASAPAGADPLSVWKSADDHLYSAKRGGRDSIAGGPFEDDSEAPSARPSATELISDLVAGLPLHSVYQPIVDLNDGHVIGYEALARPQGFGPSDSVESLFEVAHRSRQICDLDWLCRRAALSQAAALPDDVLLFINVSAAALLDPLHDVDQMLLLLDWTGRSSAQVVLEIGEHERIRDLDRLKFVLASYREAGIRFALDDLGEAFSTIELLTAVRAEYIKIARSVTLASESKESRTAIQGTLAFARSNGGVVIAEGIENEFVSDQVRLLGVSLGQGFGLGRPSVAADIPDTVAAWNARAALRPLRPRNGCGRIRLGHATSANDGMDGTERRGAAQVDFERVIHATATRSPSKSAKDPQVNHA
jgi:diguanylate cyclase (GGDEF)-like protein/PAS domain S-box-containing protein